MQLRAKALYLSFFTVAYNLIEGVVAVGLGLFTGSSALIGFGSDSFVESMSGGIMIWRFWKPRDAEDEERIERKAQKLIAIAFFTLGTYVLYEAVRSLLLHDAAEPNFFGIVIAVLSLLVMPPLAYMKYHTGKQLNSKSLVADSKQTLVCILLSAVLLFGVGLNYLFGLWWVDSVAGLFFVAILYKEGYEVFEGEEESEET